MLLNLKKLCVLSLASITLLAIALPAYAVRVRPGVGRPVVVAPIAKSAAVARTVNGKYYYGGRYYNYYYNGAYYNKCFRAAPGANVRGTRVSPTMVCI